MAGILGLSGSPYTGLSDGARARLAGNAMRCGCIGAVLHWIATYGIRERTRLDGVHSPSLLEPSTHRFACHVRQLVSELDRICTSTDTVISRSLAAVAVTSSCRRDLFPLPRPTLAIVRSFLPKDTGPCDLHLVSAWTIKLAGALNVLERGVSVAAFRTGPPTAAHKRSASNS